jgi:type VI secretion system secreted protein Hcp
MPIYIEFGAKGLPVNAGKGKIHNMAYGPTTITPRNLKQSLFQMAGESTGQSTGQRMHKPFVIRKEVDSASPLLYVALQGQKVISSLGITFTHGSEQVVATITLTNATIGKYRTWHGHASPTFGVSTVHTNALEEFSLTFHKITFQWTGGGITATDDWSAQT